MQWASDGKGTKRNAGKEHAFRDAVTMKGQPFVLSRLSTAVGETDKFKRFLPPTLLVKKQGFAPQEALQVGTQGHTSSEQFGKVMSEVKPRMAVGYHVYHDFDTEPEVRTPVRKTYDGLLSLAVDDMVWNVRKDEIRVRMAAKDFDALIRIWDNDRSTSFRSACEFRMSGRSDRL